MGNGTPIEHLTKIREAIGRTFDLSELRSLAFDLGVDIENFEGGKEAKIQGLLEYIAQNSLIPDLLDKLTKLHPDKDWYSFTPDKSEAESKEKFIESDKDHFEGIHINDVEGNAIALGQGATAAVYHGLSLDEVAQLVVKLKNEDQPVVWDGRIPYLGLTAFRESDAQFFFGREGLVDELLSRVRESNFITIAGPSGSGKSSVARAGLFHALRGGGIERSETWLLGTMQPKGDPIEQLALGIERIVKQPGTANYIREHGLKNPFALSKLVDILLSDDQRQRFVLLIDQFEEIFTQTNDENQRAAFIDLLTTAASEENGRTIIIPSLRSDFVSQCVGFPELRVLISKQFQLVGAMESPDLAKAITLPALEVGAEIDPALVKQIMDDMKGEPGALPLMSFALQDLFESEKTQKGQPIDLTLPEYLYRGGIEEALERHANKVFSNFSTEQQALAGTIFSKLIDVGEERVDTRRTATLAELIPSGINIEAVNEVIGKLARENVRLITVSSGKSIDELKTGDNFQVSVTLAHEKLIDAWPWLRNLVDENREWLRLHRRLTQDTNEWVASDRDVSLLYRGGKLAQVREKTAEHIDDLNENEQAFIEAGVQEEKRRATAIETQRQRELEATKKLATAQQRELEAQERRTIAVRRAVAGLFVLLVIACIATIFAISASLQATIDADNAATSEANAQAAATQAVAAQGTAEAEASRADAQANIVRSQSLAVSSQTIRGESPMEAFLLAIAAEKIAHSDVAMDAVNQQIVGKAKSIIGIHHEDGVLGAQWSNDESRILSWSLDQTIGVWDTDTGRQLLSLRHENSVNGAKWNGNENQILSWSDDGTVRIWDAVSGDLLLIVQHEGRSLGADWNNDESRIISWGFDGATRVWNVHSGEPELVIQLQDWVIGSSWNSNESLILSWYRDGTVGVWDAVSSNLLLSLHHENSVNGARWNENENQILSWSDDGTVRIWNAISGELEIILEHDDSILGAQWNANESLIISWSRDGVVRVWNAESGELLIPLDLEGETLINGGHWNENENRFIGWGLDGFVRVWDSSSGSLQLRLRHDDVVKGTHWNQDGSLILSWSNDGTGKIWKSDFGNLILTLIHEDRVLGAKWNNDENRILSWSIDGTAIVWDFSSNALSSPTNLSNIELIELACQYTTRNFTWEEWQLYFPGQPYERTCPQWPVHPSVPESAQ